VRAGGSAAVAQAVNVCGAQTRSGGRCQMPAGSGTSHRGYGSCARHGGHLPGPTKAAERSRAIANGSRYIAEVDIDPARAMLSAVRLAAGIRQSYLDAMAEAGDDEAKQGALMAEVRSSNRELWQAAKACSDAKVAERLVWMAERQAAMVSAAIVDAVEQAFGELATPERMAVVARTSRARLESFEGSAEEMPPELTA
jgi:hypothetical protein